MGSFSLQGSPLPCKLQPLPDSSLDTEAYFPHPRDAFSDAVCPLFIDVVRTVVITTSLDLIISGRVISGEYRVHCTLY